MLVTNQDAFDYGLAGIQHKDDKTIYTHAQDIDPVLNEIQQIKKGKNNGWTDDRSMRHVARIPHIEFLKHPEWSQEPDLMLKWLKSDAGAKYRVVTKGI